MIKRITISVPVEVAKRMKRAAGARSVSSWVTELVEDHLENEELERLWKEFYESVKPTERDKRRARALFEDLTRPRPKTKRRAA